MSVPSIQTTRGWSGLTVVDSDDHPLGKIVHIYLDRDTEQAEWALVAVAGRRRRTFVPLAGAARKGNRVAVAVSKAAMSDAPAIRPGRELSDDDAARLYGHYVGASGDHRRGGRRRPPGAGARPGDPVQGDDRSTREVGGSSAGNGQEPGAGGRAVRPRAAGAVAGRAGLGGDDRVRRRTRTKPSGAGRRRGARRDAGRDPGPPDRPAAANAEGTNGG
jgi:hypothetical protein